MPQVLAATLHVKRNQASLVFQHGRQTWWGLQWGSWNLEFGPVLGSCSHTGKMLLPFNSIGVTVSRICFAESLHTNSFCDSFLENCIFSTASRCSFFRLPVPYHINLKPEANTSQFPTKFLQSTSLVYWSILGDEDRMGLIGWSIGHSHGHPTPKLYSLNVPSTHVFIIIHKPQIHAPTNSFKQWLTPTRHWFKTNQTTDQPTEQPTDRPTGEATDLPTYPPTDLPTSQSIHRPFYLSIFPSFYLAIFLCFCLFYPFLFFALLSYPFLSFPFLSFPFLSVRILSYSFLSYPILFFHFLLSYPFLSDPILSYHVLSFPILSFPIMSFLFLSYAVLSYPIVSIYLVLQLKSTEWAHSALQFQNRAKTCEQAPMLHVTKALKRLHV